MANPFPSPEYVDLCIEHQNLLAKGWEKLGPRKGDFYMVRRRNGDLLKVLISNRRGKEFNIWLRTHEKVFVPRLDQLQEMLEERGCFWDMCGPFPDTAWIDDCEEYLVEIEYKNVAGLLQDGGAYGSTSAIALLNCLVDVWSKGR